SKPTRCAWPALCEISDHTTANSHRRQPFGAGQAERGVIVANPSVIRYKGRGCRQHRGLTALGYGLPSSEAEIFHAPRDDGDALLTHRFIPANAMCGRYTLRTDSSQLVEAFQLEDAPEISPRYNIAPT